MGEIQSNSKTIKLDIVSHSHSTMDQPLLPRNIVSCYGPSLPKLKSGLYSGNHCAQD